MKRSISKVVVVHWRGPFSEEELSALEDAGVLYLLTGRLSKGQKIRFQYCGLTETLLRYRQRLHRKFPRVQHNLQIWIGWLDHPNPLVPKRADLEAAESVLVYYWGDLINEKKTVSSPKLSTTVVSHWFDKGEPLIPRRVPPRALLNLPDLICWNAETQNWKAAFYCDSWKDTSVRKICRPRS